MDGIERLCSTEFFETKYSEYISWLEQQDKEAGLRYWKNVLSGYDSTAEIQGLSTQQESAEESAQMETVFSHKMSQELIKLAAQNNVTINTVAESIWGILLQRYNYTDDVVFGKVVSGRNAPIKGIEEMVGLFINTIPIRVRSKAGMKITELWAELQEQSIESSSYDYSSLAEVQNLTPQGRDLIKTLFVFENYYVKERTDNKGLKLQLVSSREQTNYDITATAYLEDGCIHWGILYDPRKYSHAEIKQLLKRIEIIATTMTKNPYGIVF